MLLAISSASATMVDLEVIGRMVSTLKRQRKPAPSFFKVMKVRPRQRCKSSMLFSRMPSDEYLYPCESVPPAQKNKRGKVQRAEFEAMFVRELKLPAEDAAAVFLLMDADSDGAISLADFNAAARAYAAEQAAVASEQRQAELAARQAEVEALEEQMRQEHAARKK